MRVDDMAKNVERAAWARMAPVEKRDVAVEMAIG